ncbi:amidohydrolase family protein [Maricurvus nonylphenolicus]|uniref:amidohydrolase family protein n=1 Tax=Maricurvus nonylphenolicus TaxID=1008307 RepID=UPI0036F2F416
MARFAKGACISLLILHFVFIFSLTSFASGLSLGLFLLALGVILVSRFEFSSSLPYKSLLTVSLLLLANVTLEFSSAPTPSRNYVALVGGNIITGQEGAEVIHNGTVLIDPAGKIVEVAKSDAINVPANYEVIDAAGKFVMPGLINAHTHLFKDAADPDLPMDVTSMAVPGYRHSINMYIADSYLGKRYLAAVMANNAKKELFTGVTTLRAIGEVGFLDVALREKIAEGKLVGPNLLVAGKILAITGGHAADIGMVINGPVEARRAVREALRNKVDFIKITNTGGVADSRRLGEAGELQMTPEEVTAIVDEAHRKNILVAAHAESTQGVKEALLAGVDNIEHGAILDDEMIELFRNNPNALRGYTSLHPTLSVFAKGVNWTEEAKSVAALSIIGRNALMVGEQLISGFKQAVDNDVLVGVGTDSGFISHKAVWKELKYFQEFANVSADKAIHMGTLATAKSIGIDAQTGSIEAGKRADLLVVDGDPRKDLSLISKPLVISVNGYIHTR